MSNKFHPDMMEKIKKYDPELRACPALLDGTPLTGTTLDMLRARGDSLSLDAVAKIVLLRKHVERLESQILEVSTGLDLRKLRNWDNEN